MPVTVIVQECASSAPARLLIPQPGSLRHVGKGSIPIVVIEPVLSEISTENIVESVVVVVSYANTASPANSLQARFFSYVREGAIAIISIEAVRGVSGMAIEARPRKQKDIHPAVIVVIEKRTSKIYFLLSTPP